MKTRPFILFTALLFLAQFGSAQDFLGDWLVYATDTKGNSTINKFSLAANGTISIDYGNDEEVEVITSYSIAGNQLLIKNTAKGSPCEGLLMIYEFQLDEVPNTIKVIEDQCSLDQRKGAVWKSRRMNYTNTLKNL